MNRLLIILWLTFVWVLLWGGLTLGNVLAGVAIATVLVLLFPLGPDRGGGVHPLAVLRFGLFFAWALVVATWTVVVTLLRPRLALEQGIVAVPMRATSPVVVAFVANSISLTPGTLTVDVRPRTYGIDAGPDDTEAPVLYVHCLVVGDPETVRADARHVEELAVRAFGTVRDRAALEQEASR
jgi:multicomponent Na+:H+ antiporter subunit E